MKVICPKCNIPKPTSEFKTNIFKPLKVDGKCRDCRNEYNRAYYAKNIERLRARAKKVRDARGTEDREHAQARQNEWRKQNRQKYNEQQRQNYARVMTEERKKERNAKLKVRRDALDITYIRKLLASNNSSLSFGDIPLELALAHRELLKLKRLVREKSNEKRS